MALRAVASILAALVLATCSHAPSLQSQAENRVAQIEQSCTPTPTASCISHEGFAGVQPVNAGDWYGEALFAQTEPMTMEAALLAWLASPAHRAILLHPEITYWGYAQSEQPVGGWWYAVMLVEAAE